MRAVMRYEPLTVFAGAWRLFISRFTSVHGDYALFKSTIDTDIDSMGVRT